MAAITHYEVYEATGDQWMMVARFMGSERELAFNLARAIEDEKRLAAAIVEEHEDMTSAQFDTRQVYRSVAAGPHLRAPMNVDLISRFFMVALNAVTIGVIAAVLGAVALSRASTQASWHSIALFGIFAGATILSGLTLFRLYVPVGVILWKSKDPESRRRTILALQAQGNTVSAPPPPGPNSYSQLAPSAPRTAPKDDFQTTVAAPPALQADVQQVPTPAEVDATPAQTPPPAATAAAPADGTAPPEAAAAPAAEMPATPAEPVLPAPETPAAIVGRLRPILTKFAETCVATIAATQPVLPASEQLALRLYFLGAALDAGERNGLNIGAARELGNSMIARTGATSEEIAGFMTEAEVAGERPRYRRMMDDGKNAITEVLGTASATPLPGIVELLKRWTEQRGNDAQQFTFLLTDMVGSTAMTSELGNAGAQRVVRAHNILVRAAAKAFRGREVKHTGDGILLIFPDATSAGRAAMDIQQEAANFAAENPTAPLAMRIGVHTGEAVYEDGEYYGAAVTTVNGLCSAVSTSEIGCTASVRLKMPTSLKFEDLGEVSLKGIANAVHIVKLLWEPKRGGKKPGLEYRQIGTAPAPAAGGGAQ